MNNEPVAWMVKAPDGEYLVFEKSEHPVMDDCTYIPLYAHPVKELTLTHEEYDNIFSNGKRLGVIETENRIWKAMQLTDEEIKDVLQTDFDDCIDLVRFARAILRKAQEK